MPPKAIQNNPTQVSQQIKNNPLLAAEVDELGALEKELLPFAEKIKRIDALRKRIRIEFDSVPAADAREVHGKRFFAVVGPRAFQRTIDMVELIKSIGLKVFSRLATMSLATLEDNVDPVVVSKVVSTAQTGTRPLKTFERV